jgi:hypothetical protein
MPGGLENPSEGTPSVAAYYSPETRARLAEFGSIGGHIGWANTDDRNARMANAHANGPGEIAWHARKLGFNPDNMTPTEVLRAQNAKSAYFKRLSMQARDAKAARKAAGET